MAQGQADSGRSSDCDVLVVGGGINGAGIARDLAGRGFRVVLCEQHDLAQHTSSASTKLIHGGLRYLEHFEFKLVRKALAEREGLLRALPHIARPLRLVLLHEPSMRPAWMIRIGLFLYDHLARRDLLAGSETLNLKMHVVGRPLQARFTRGFAYSDGWVDDARLVVLNAIDAAHHGARILTRCEVLKATRESSQWRAELRHADGQIEQVKARALVNAAGPWAGGFLSDQCGLQNAKPLRLVKGSHIVVKKLFDHDMAYVFQAPDKRIVFAIPYERDFTLIGTTDVDHGQSPGVARIDDAEIAYLCGQASRCFEKPVAPSDVVWTYSGVRPLIDDGSNDASAVTRDYLLELDIQRRANGCSPDEQPSDGISDAAMDQSAAPCLTVWGGKITTFRKLAEEAADRLCSALGQPRRPWTSGQPLPGGDLSAWIGPTSRPELDIVQFEQALRRAHPALPAPVVQRWARAYGSRVDLLLKDGLGNEVVPGLFEAELRYLQTHEWALTLDDVLWRRTKLGLHLNDAQHQALSQWWQSHSPPRMP